MENSRKFFKGDLAEFRVEKILSLKGPGQFQSRPRLDAVKTAYRIGEGWRAPPLGFVF